VVHAHELHTHRHLDDLRKPWPPRRHHVGANLLQQGPTVAIVAHVAIAAPVAKAMAATIAIRTDGSMACLSRGRPRRFAARRDQLPLGWRENPLQSHH
jgi:hypothetical protein